MNKKYLAIVAGIVILIIILLIAWLRGGLSSSENSSFKPYSPDIEKIVYIYTQELRARADNESGENNQKTANILITPIVSFNIHSSELVIKEAKIKDIEVSNIRVGDIEIRKPKHISRNGESSDNYIHPFEAMEDNKMISYLLTDQEDPLSRMYDEVGKDGGMMEFEIAILNIGKCAEDEIEQKYGSLSPRNVLKCSASDVSIDDLNGTVSFVLELNFESGKTYQKKFVGQWYARDILESDTTYELEIQ